MDKRGHAFAARALVKDSTFKEQVERVLSRLNEEILSAKSQEAREMKFQEFDGLRKVWRSLGVLAAEADKYLAEDS